MRLFFQVVFASYLLVLLWLVLFKLSVDIPAVLDHQTRSLNLVPLAQGNVREMLYNLIVFIPFGLLLSVNFKHITFWRKAAFVAVFSVVAEIIQFILAIGTTDITDVIMNVGGGLLGLALYGVSGKNNDNSKLDYLIAGAGAVLLVLFILVRFLVFKVRY